jgi:hypothetical protein
VTQGTGPTTPQYQPGPDAKPQGLAVASLVLGIVSFVICWIPVLGYAAIITDICAIVFGVMARNAVKKGTGGGGGMATAGMILGIVHLSIYIIVSILAIVGISMFGGAMKEAIEEAERQQRMNQTAPVEMFRMTLEYVSTNVRALLN